jgi:hypothetical protein
MSPRTLATIARHELRHTLRTGVGIVMVVITMMTFLTIGNVFVVGVNALQDPTRAPGHGMSLDEYVKLGADVVTFFFGADFHHVHFLVESKPALVTVIWLAIGVAVPFLTGAIAFNQTASAIDRKALRFQLLRASRAEILIGRFLAALAFTEILIVLFMSILAAYVALNVTAYPASQTLPYFAQVTLALALLAVPYVALAGFVSTLIPRPGIASMVTAILIGGIPLAAILANQALNGLSAIGYLTPWPLRYDFVHPSFAVEVGAALAMLGYTAVYLFAAYRSFAARDL